MDCYESCNCYKTRQVQEFVKCMKMQNSVKHLKIVTCDEWSVPLGICNRIKIIHRRTNLISYYHNNHVWMLNSRFNKRSWSDCQCSTVYSEIHTEQLIDNENTYNWSTLTYSSFDSTNSLWWELHCQIMISFVKSSEWIKTLETHDSIRTVSSKTLFQRNVHIL